MSHIREARLWGLDCNVLQTVTTLRTPRPDRPLEPFEYLLKVTNQVRWMFADNSP